MGKLEKQTEFSKNGFDTKKNSSFYYRNEDKLTVVNFFKFIVRGPLSSLLEIWR